MKRNIGINLAIVASAAVLAAACSSAAEHRDPAAAELGTTSTELTIGHIGGGPIIGDTWSNAWDSLGGKVYKGTSPTLIQVGTRLHAFIHAATGDVQWNYKDNGGSWSGWSSLGDVVGGQNIVAVQDTDASYLVILYTHGSDALIHANLYDGQWHGAVSTGLGPVLGDPVATYLQTPNQVTGIFGGGYIPYVNVYGWDRGSGQIADSYFLINAPDDPNPWTIQSGQPSSITPGAPLALVSSDTVSVDLFATAGTTTHAHRNDATQPFTWETVPVGANVYTEALSATSTAPGHVDLAWEGAAGGDAHTKALVNGVWQPNADLGASLFAGKQYTRPSVAAFQDQLAIVSVGADYQIESALVSEGQSGSAFAPIGTGCEGFSSAPTVVATSSTQLDLLAVGSDYAVYHTTFQPSLGGNGAEPPTCSCGGSGQECCGTGGGSCTGPGLVCNSANTCAACGYTTSQCCSGNVCNAGNICESDRCVACGDNGEVCCPGNACNGGGLSCGSNGTCALPPGTLGGSCENGGCPSPLVCQSGTCATPPPPPQCNGAASDARTSSMTIGVRLTNGCAEAFTYRADTLQEAYNCAQLANPGATVYPTPNYRAYPGSYDVTDSIGEEACFGVTVNAFTAADAALCAASACRQSYPCSSDSCDECDGSSTACP